MKNLQYSLIAILISILLQITSCNSNASKITLILPVAGTQGQNVLTARLVWTSGCDSFNVFLGTDSVSDRIPKVATVKWKVYNTARLENNVTYYWRIEGFAQNKIAKSSPIWSFTTRRHSDTSGLSSEYGIVRNGVGYFQDSNGKEVKAVDLDSFEELWKYNFSDLYDVSPMVEKTMNGTWLMIEHERANGRLKALYLADGKEAWTSDNNIPYIGGTGFNYYINKKGLTVVLAKGSNGLHALSIEDGKELWFAPAQSWFSTIPAVDQKNRWIYSQSFEIAEKIDAETGKVIRSAYRIPEAMTSHSNTLLVDDNHGYYVATVNWNGSVLNGDLSVYDSTLKLVWKKNRFVERLSSISYHDGTLFSAQCGGWYESEQSETAKHQWKYITAYDIQNGNVKWNLSLAKYNYINIHDVVYCNNYLYALTDNTGLSVKENRLLFRIRASDGFLEEVLNFGFPLSICASPLISGGKLFEAGVPTRLGDGDKCDWYGQYGVPQLNQNAADDKAVIILSKMKNLKFNRAD
jgi:PQQ-like domain